MVSGLVLACFFRDDFLRAMAAPPAHARRDFEIVAKMIEVQRAHGHGRDRFVSQHEFDRAIRPEMAGGKTLFDDHRRVTTSGLVNHRLERAIIRMIRDHDGVGPLDRLLIAALCT